MNAGWWSCAAVQDLLRSCYRSQMRLFLDHPEILTWGQWHWCPPGAEPLPFAHAFGSSVWDDDEFFDPAIGEVRPAHIAWRRGEGTPRADGRHWCGGIDLWQHGSPLELQGSLELDADGWPVCCPAVPLVGGILLGGSAIIAGIIEAEGCECDALTVNAAQAPAVAPAACECDELATGSAVPPADTLDACECDELATVLTGQDSDLADACECDELATVLTGQDSDLADACECDELATGSAVPPADTLDACECDELATVLTGQDSDLADACECDELATAVTGPNSAAAEGCECDELTPDAAQAGAANPNPCECDELATSSAVPPADTFDACECDDLSTVLNDTLS